MERHRKLAMPVLLTVAALTLGACGGQGSGSDGQQQGDGGGMQGMNHGNNSGGQQETTVASGGESTGGMPGGTTMMGAGETTGMQGMEGMDHGQMGAGGMAAMSREMVMENGEYSDRAFIDSMVPHHRGAVDMAEVALDNAEHDEIRNLAEDIVGAQEAEIKELGEIRKREFGSAESSEEMSDMDMQMMGMTDPQELANKRPFDKAFIDAMIPHHRSAIAMAKVALKESDNSEIKGIARDIVEAQRREIGQMEGWREQWYGQS
ncbi:DUF305 domain-containing protein [Rubrobacter tropicus]|uniref:DUF305 domain-containing protein n=1 Tax=Rubrobacter tropicus TaxID=2653851 RepID=A0A6G8QDG1_9ACTN|nr:DUF305 domain-containing protein [Rubrobacter tropicus]QIN84535.1 DUF305 domain-containing protein [Rubrobacter tropicus]